MSRPSTTQSSLRASTGVDVTPMLQATNAHRFHPGAAPADSGPEVLFVGSTRGEYRPAVRACIEGGVDLTLYGVGWSQYLPEARIAGEFLANEQLPAAYAAAHVVLNDHWPDMAAEGFLSNRLFDSVATATRVLSDDARGLHEVFGPMVRTFDRPDDIPALLALDLDVNFADRTSRLEAAKIIARDHSFDARAAELIDRARSLRSQR